jgi:hypothetical protein
VKCFLAYWRSTRRISLDEDLEAVKPEARLKFMADLMKHLIPKPKAQEENEQTKPSKIEIVIHKPKEPRDTLDAS